MAREPEHLARVKKACPRSGCRSCNVKWRYYNNGKLTQPRYQCLGCGEYFTFGGKVRLSKKEKEAATAAAGLAVSTKARTKITPTKSSSTNLRAVKELQLIKESGPNRPRISTRKDQSGLQPASPIPKAKSFTGSFRLRLSTGNVIELPRTSSHEESEADAGARMSSPAAMLRPGVVQGMLTGLEPIMEAGHDGACKFEEAFGLVLPNLELVHYDARSLWPHPKVDRCGANSGCEFEVWEPESELLDDDGSELGGDASLDIRVKAPEDCGPAFSWTSSEQLWGPIVRCGGLSAPELLDSEMDVQLIDTGLSSLKSWKDIFM